MQIKREKFYFVIFLAFFNSVALGDYAYLYFKKTKKLYLQRIDREREKLRNNKSFCL